MSQKILLIEDDLSIVEIIKTHLYSEGYNVDSSINFDESLQKILSSEYDLVLLDLMLPNFSGKDLLLNLRKSTSIPVIIISAKSSDIDKALLLGLGADDYLAKPFSLIELSARINSCLRRSNNSFLFEKEKNTTVSIGNLIINFDNYTVTKNNVPIKLTSKEFQILKFFINNPNIVFTKQQLYNRIWEDNYLSDNNIINVHIQRLRKKIEVDPSNPKIILTLWGIGYKLGDF